MKKLVSAAVIAALVAGTASAEVKTKINANGHYGTNLWKGIAAEEASSTEDDSYWYDGAKDSWTDDVTLQITSDNAGVKIVESIGSGSVAMNNYDVWVKYGDLRLDFGKIVNRAGIIGDSNGNWITTGTILNKPGINNGVITAYKNRGYLIGSDLECDVTDEAVEAAKRNAAKTAYDKVIAKYTAVKVGKKDGSGTDTLYYDENGYDVTDAAKKAAKAAAEEAYAKEPDLSISWDSDSSLAKFGADSTSYSADYTGTKQNALWLTYGLGDLTLRGTMFTNKSKTFTDFNLQAEYKKDALDASLTMKFTDTLSGRDSEKDRYALGTDFLTALAVKYDINDELSVFGAYTLGLPYMGREFSASYSYTDDGGSNITESESYSAMTMIHAVDLRAQYKSGAIMALGAVNFTMINPSKYTKEIFKAAYDTDAETVMGIDVGAQFQYTLSDMVLIDFQTRYDCYDLMKKNDTEGLNSLIVRPGVVLAAEKNCTLTTGVEVTLDNMFTSEKDENSDKGMLVITTAIPLVFRVKL